MFSMNRSLFRSVRGTLSSAARSSAVRTIVGIAGLAATSGTALAQDCKAGRAGHAQRALRRAERECGCRRVFPVGHSSGPTANAYAALRSTQAAIVACD